MKEEEDPLEHEGRIQDTDQEWDEIREVEGMPPPPGEANPDDDEPEY